MTAEQMLYHIPAHLISGYESGAYKLFNSILKDAATGHIVGHVQQTDALSKMIGAATNGGLNVLSGGFSPLSAVTMLQNQQIKNQLDAVQQGMGMLQNLQVAGLALSGVNLGISVVGFAMMMKRLTAITQHLDRLEERVDKVTADRREDGLRDLLASLAAALENVDTLHLRRDPTYVAEALQLQLDELLFMLAARFRQVLDQNALVEEDLDLLWTIASAVRLCHEASDRALFVAEQLQLAATRAERQSSALLEMTGALSSDLLARRIAQASAPDERQARRRAVLPQAQMLMSGLQEAIGTTAGRASLTHSLFAQGASGRAYLESVESEKEHTLLFLPERQKVATG